MGNLLFSPSGRIGPSEFTKGIMILAVISAVLTLLPMVSMSLAMIGGLVSLLLLVPFFMLNIKRAHDAGKSGWMSIVHFIIYIILGVALSFLVGMFFAGSVDPEAMQAAAEEAAAAGDLAGVMEAAGDAAKAQAIPSAIGGLVISYIFAMIINAINKKDMHENQYGPA